MEPGSPDAIKRLRHRLGLTQAEFALRLGTDAGTVSRWERGVVSPRPGALLRLAELRAGQALAELTRRLVRAVGKKRVATLLNRELLLAAKPSAMRFAFDTAERLREVDRARTEQLALKGALGGGARQ